jgi:hypothetical protein
MVAPVENARDPLSRRRDRAGQTLLWSVLGRPFARPTVVHPVCGFSLEADACILGIT